MNEKYILTFFKKNTDTSTEQTKTKPQETFEIKMNEQMQTFLFNPPINPVEESKWLLAVTFLEAAKSFFIITKENNSFSITILGHCNSKSAEKSFDELNKSLEIRSENDIGLHVNQVKKK